jgi:hypothetical protein
MGVDRKAEEERLIALMIGYQKGSMDDFEGLYAALKQPLLRYLWTFVRNATVAEDLLQDTFDAPAFRPSSQRNVGRRSAAGGPGAA